MNRFFFIILILLGLTNNPSWAKLLEITYDGQIDMQYLSLDNESDFLNTNSGTGANDDYQNEVRTRVLLGLNFGLANKIEGRILIAKNNRLWGDSLLSANGTEYISDILYLTGIWNAYIKMDRVLGWIDLSIGRQFYGEKDDFIFYVGPRENNNLDIDALDMIKCETSLFWSWIDTEFIASKIKEAGKPTIDDTSKPGREIGNLWRKSNWDVDLLGLQITTKRLFNNRGKWNWFYYDYTQNNSAQKDIDNFGIIGTRLYFPVPFVEDINIRMQAAMNTGRQPETSGIRKVYRGQGVVLGIDGLFDIHPGGKLTLKLESAQGSGDNPDTKETDEGFWSLNSNLQYGEIWWKTGPMKTGASYGLGPERFGTSEISNYKIFVFKSEITPKILYNKFDLKFDFYRYYLTLAGSSDDTITTNIRENENELGTEIDLGIKYRYSSDVEFKSVYAIFLPGKRYFLVDRINRFSINMGIRF